jgi:hypothetical protein
MFRSGQKEHMSCRVYKKGVFPASVAAGRQYLARYRFYSLAFAKFERSLRQTNDLRTFLVFMINESGKLAKRHDICKYIMTMKSPNGRNWTGLA